MAANTTISLTWRRLWTYSRSSNYPQLSWSVICNFKIKPCSSSPVNCMLVRIKSFFYCYYVRHLIFSANYIDIVIACPALIQVMESENRIWSLHFYCNRSKITVKGRSSAVVRDVSLSHQVGVQSSLSTFAREGLPRFILSLDPTNVGAGLPDLG